jgi:hypothetical protein
METKKYSSYAEIDQDLKILKVEREIHYQKILLSVDKTKDSFLPPKSVSFVADLYHKVLSGSTGKIVTFAVPYLIKWFINRKRGD